MSNEKDPLIELGEVIFKDLKNFIKFVAWSVKELAVIAFYAVVAVAYPVAYFLGALFALFVLAFVMAWSMGSFLGFEHMQPEIGNSVVAVIGQGANFLSPILGPLGIMLAVGILLVGWMVWIVFGSVISSMT
jgi:hypothetical protein